ncbi:MAG: peptidoglycan-binding protein [Desulfobacteria bacterium]
MCAAGSKPKPRPASPAKPVGDEGYEVQAGECLNVIADRFGFFPKTLWDHPKNAALKSGRKDPNVLLPGDRVFIPEKALREESAATGQRQRFRRKGVPSKMKIRLQRCGTAEPYANKRYVLNVDGKLSEGTVDGEGNVALPIPPGTRKAVLTVGEGEAQESFDLEFGALDPPDSIRGAQQRLRNLGFLSGEPMGKWDPASESALVRFQVQHVVTGDEEPSGVFDEMTKEKLKAVHEC